MLIAPASTEKDGIWLPFMDRSADDGITWTKTPLFAGPKYLGAGVRLIQPTLWEDKDRVRHCFLRSDKGRLYRSDSFDDGITWNKPYRTRIPNNNSGVDCCSDMLGRIWLVYNPIGVNWGPRTPLILSVSENNGSYFSPVLTLEEGAGEFSYPSVVCTGNSLHITYTYNRKQIAYYKIQLEAQQRL
jgi:predicted neuraminidase